MLLSVIIPAYNEEKNLAKTVKEFFGYFSGKEYGVEIIIVNDGSTDRTAEIARGLASELILVKLLDNNINRGKGAAIREGLAAAQGDHALFIDADGATSIDHLDLAWPLLQAGKEVVIASRSYHDHPATAQVVKQAAWKRWLGLCGNRIIQALAVKDIWDTQCGFKIFSRRSLEIILPLMTIDRWAFDVEMLVVAQRHRLSIGIVPVQWKNSDFSRVGFSGYLSSLKEVVKIKMNLLNHKYDSPDFRNIPYPVKRNNRGSVARTYWSALALALVFGLAAICPTVTSIGKNGWNDFRGIYPILSDDESYYLALGQEMLEGHGRLGNPFYFEHKNSPELVSSWPSRLLAAEAKLLRQSMPTTYVLNDFLLVFIGVLSLYFFLLLLSNNRRWVLAGAGIYYLLFLFTFNRPVIPQLGMIFLFWGLNLIWRIHIAEDGKKNMILSLILGLLVGVLVYVYPYYWTSLAAIYGLTIGWAIIKRRKKWYLSPLLFLISFLPFAMAYLFGMSAVSRLPYYAETTARLGLLSTHWPACYFNVALLAAMLLAVCLVWPKLSLQKKSFALILLVAGIGLNWSNVVTGKYLQFSSHYYMVTVLIVGLNILLVCPDMLKSLREYLRKEEQWPTAWRLWVAALLILLVALAVAAKQKTEMMGGIKLLGGASADQMNHLQTYRPMFDWLQANTPADSVVMVFDSNLIDLIPIYSHNNLYAYGYGGAFLLSDQEMERRWIGQQLASGRFEPDINFINDNHRALWVNGLIDNYQNKSMRNKVLDLIGIKASPAEMFDARINRVYDTWQELKNLPLREVLGAYRLDYFIDECSSGRQLGAKLFESGGLCVYKN